MICIDEGVSLIIESRKETRARLRHIERPAGDVYSPHEKIADHGAVDAGDKRWLHLSREGSGRRFRNYSVGHRWLWNVKAYLCDRFGIENLQRGKSPCHFTGTAISINPSNIEDDSRSVSVQLP